MSSVSQWSCCHLFYTHQFESHVFLVRCLAKLSDSKWWFIRVTYPFPRTQTSYLHSIFLGFAHLFLLLKLNACYHEENADGSKAKQETLCRKCLTVRWADSPLGCTCWRKHRSHGGHWACWIHWSEDGPVQLGTHSYPDHWWQAAGWYQRSTWKETCRQTSMLSESRVQVQSRIHKDGNAVMAGR